jgi:Tol biopolymer transport system component
MVAETVRGRFSPDGRWVVYSEGDNTKSEVYVQSFPLRSLRMQLTSAGGQAPIWRGDGKEILYRNVHTLYSIRVELKGNTLDASAPEALFDVITSVSNGSLSTMPMAVTRDGSKILFPQGQPLPPTYVMTAWDTLLKR